MEDKAILEKVQARFGSRILRTDSFRGQSSVTVLPETLHDVVRFLKEDAELDMNVLVDLGGVDYLGFKPAEADEDYEGHPWRFEVVYHFMSYKLRHRFRVKVAVKDETVKVPTLALVFRGANWMEREVWDMYGVVFDGHKHLKRILNHDAFEGHPLRKDYPINKRQKLPQPTIWLFPDDQDWA